VKKFSCGTNQYIHISPCGDWWIGTEIFAAKHLPSDFVKSILLPTKYDVKLLNSLPQSHFIGMYETGTLHESIVNH
jgi:hypothetical protein